MADLDDHVVQWLASIRLYDPGQGDPVIQDHGLDWYSAVAWCWAQGQPSYTSGGKTHLEYLEGIGLVCRPFLTLQDTRKSNYTFHASADWDEVRPGAGSPRHYRLFQNNSTPNLVWWAKSTFTLPKDPHVAFSFIFADTPADQDGDLYPPFVRIELGGDNPTWGIEFNKTDGCRLLRWWNNQWVEAAQLEEPQGLGFGDNEEKVVIVRVLRGQICLSTNWGKSYTRFSYPDGTAASIPAGKYAIRGTGGVLIHGLQQLVYQSGTFTSPTKNTFTSRIVPPATSFVKRSYEPSGTSAALADLSQPGNAIAQWKATLTPTSTGSVPFAFYSTPELYSVWLNYAVVRSTPTLTYTTPWDGDLRSLRISKPRELDQGTLTWEVHGDSESPFVYAGRWRKVQVVLTELLDDGTNGQTASFVGYVQNPAAEQSEYHAKPLSFSAVNATIPAKRMKWNELSGIPPLGGMTGNAALDICLDRMGLTTAYRTWHVWGNQLLPPGLPEDPAFWPKPNDTLWDTMTEIASFFGLELFVDDAGQWHTLPKLYVNPTVTKQWDLDPATDYKQLLFRVRFSNDAMENVTAVLVKAHDLYGNALYGYAVDTYAETDPTSVRFSPWRETESEEVQFPITAAMAAGRAGFLANDMTVPKFPAEVEGPSDLSLSRRDRCNVLNSHVGIANTDEFWIETLDHTWTAIDRLGEIRTVAGLRRIGG